MGQKRKRKRKDLGRVLSVALLKKYVRHWSNRKVWGHHYTLWTFELKLSSIIPSYAKGQLSFDLQNQLCKKSIV
jgi:hypothetical protein